MNGDIDRALKRLKHKLNRQGVYQEIKRCRFYMKPSEERRLKLKEAKRRIARDRKRRLIRSCEWPDPKPKRVISIRRADG
jgi:ribosomal protein S21